MNITVSKVYDIERFAWFMHLKYGFNLSYIKMLSTCINEENKYSFINLTEVEVRYLQRPNLQYTEHFCAISKPICDLKILNNNMGNRPSIPPYLDNEREQESKKYKIEYKVIEIITKGCFATEEEINKLLNDPNVKSINIEK